MAKKTRTSDVTTADYRQTGEKRKNIPPAKIAAEGKVPRIARVRYAYSPHLPPALRVDPTGKTDRLPDLVAAAGKRTLNDSEQQLLAEALRNQQPWIEWADKQEQHDRGFLEVDPVALHIHERISTQAILRAASREDVQRELFADPQQSYAQAVQFYRHDVDWANRMILGDSLQVMTSLARREGLVGKVQAVYMDPPYGIKFSSNFQPQLQQRDVKDRDQDLTREPEMVRAYRDTWTLGTHSYLSYLRDRLIAARDLLHETGSIFVQISDENVHRVRCLLDEVFGPGNFISQVTIRKTTGSTADFIPGSCDYLLWYGRNKDRTKFRAIFDEKKPGEEGATGYSRLELRNGERRALQEVEQLNPSLVPEGAHIFAGDNVTSQSVGRDKGEGAASWFKIEVDGFSFTPGPKARWKSNEDGMKRLKLAGRLIGGDRATLSYKRYLSDFRVTPISNIWTDTVGQNQLGGEKVYIVQTALKIVERCILMTTDPGDVVLDPTCGSGTAALMAEHWGRRWITCDTSRVALSIARQRLMTTRFPYFALRTLNPQDRERNPAGTWLTDSSGQVSGKVTFKCKPVPHITLRSIAQNAMLDPIFANHEPILKKRLADLNDSLELVSSESRQKLANKLAAKIKKEGRKAVTEADRRRWDLPKDAWHEWNVPFDVDGDWPESLRDALTAYRSAWRQKMDDVNACLAANAEIEEVLNRPETISGIVRVSGPFTVEGVRPEELSLGDNGLFDTTPNEAEGDLEASDDADNSLTYLTQMVQHLRTDGLTFLGNQHRKFSSLDPLFEGGSGSLIHADGSWEGDAGDKGNTVAITFGPQHGPVTALQLEEAIRAAKQYDELVIAGFSFDAEAFAVAEEQSHPKLRVHLAQIRPDLNQAMQGLLKDTPNSQLFTVFGQPDVEVKRTKDAWICSLHGVEIYNPVDNTVRSSGADKVAAWFLDSDFDGRCFCIAQAFFPDQAAWEKIAKALGSSADQAAFEAFRGTTSLPFQRGKYARIAVKVIDPRGNEVMAVRKLGAT